MGIGVFVHHDSVGYVEIMKELAQEQKLLLILATDDYIYGTNYQFCHGYLEKDLVHLHKKKSFRHLGVLDVTSKIKTTQSVCAIIHL